MDRRVSKLEAGFAARQQLRDQLTREEIQELYDENFGGKNDSGTKKGTDTVANFGKIKTKIETSRVTGTHIGHAVRDASSKGEMNTAISLERILQNERATMLFYAFATVRLVNEGILFWNAVESFQNMNWKPNRLLGITGSSAADMRLHAKHIFTEYLDENAPTEVCVPSDMLDGLRKRIFYETADNQIVDSIFVEAQRHVFRDMEKGLFREFLNSLNHKGLESVMSSLEIRSAPGLATATAMRMTSRRGEFKVDDDTETKAAH
ncbi:Regulator of G-protein signaling 4 [Hondaea fermentalgiana]|uniref:Regulator of G-protein signaling 4 n=1 Tax=Hondaea fermentalgiana TaxID=2315210 RepID=A0A2R5G6C3_9STRA|nr:Regulator of G-protein signaling 4 [Hondaea fermentalgiana]|eukprot:GBG25338.1 Regulator of G-protein signaling 4 [Hondaea fermentalgiana]